MRHLTACLLAVPLCLACAAAQAQQPPAPKPPEKADRAASNLPVVRLIATGGTIAMKIDPVKKAPVPAISGEDLIATVPEIKVAGPATSSTPPASASRPPHAGWAR